MMIGLVRTLVIAMTVLAVRNVDAAPDGDIQRGAKVFAACAACHSLKPGYHMTGPSLASIWGRKAGIVDAFRRYSGALKRSGIRWNEQSLDAWLRDPAAFIPGTSMTFRGIDDTSSRRDLIAFLRAVSEGAAPKEAAGESMGAQQLPDLKKLGGRFRIASIRYCPDTYYVTTGTGERVVFWEPNLRFKTDSSALGPAPGEPVLLPSGMMGDRAQAVFAAPEEISSFVKRDCADG